MPEHKRILSVAYLRDLGESRQALLRAAGYHVTTVDSVSGAVLQLKKARFDLVIVGPVSYTHLTLPTNREV